jgi:hypothetical protein
MNNRASDPATGLYYCRARYYDPATPLAERRDYFAASRGASPSNVLFALEITPFA